MHGVTPFLASLATLLNFIVISRFSSPTFFSTYAAILVIEQLFNIFYIASVVQPFSLGFSRHGNRSARSNLFDEYVVLTFILCLLLTLSIRLFIETTHISINILKPIPSVGYLTFYFFISTRSILTLLRRKLLLLTDYKRLLLIDLSLLLIVPCTSIYVIYINAPLSTLFLSINILNIATLSGLVLIPFLKDYRPLHICTAFKSSFKNGRWLIANAFFNSFSSSFVTILVSQLAGLEILALIKLCSSVFRPSSLLSSSVGTKLLSSYKEKSFNSSQVFTLFDLLAFDNSKYVLMSLSYILLVLLFSTNIAHLLSPGQFRPALNYTRILAFQQIILSLTVPLQSLFFVNGKTKILPISTILSITSSIFISLVFLNLPVHLAVSLLFLIPHTVVFLFLLFNTPTPRDSSYT